MRPARIWLGGATTESLRHLFARFLRFGLQAWGGPIAQIGMMHREMVERERWIDEPTFRRVLAVYQILPGPEAHELAVYFGYHRRGRWGGFLAGLGFMLPGFLLTLLLAFVYVRFGTQAWGVSGLLYAVKPVAIALILNALIRIGRMALTNEPLVLVAMGAFLASWVASLHFALVLGLLGVAYYAVRRRDTNASGFLALPLLLTWATPPFVFVLFLFFLQAGLLTFGGAYTVLPFIEEAAVRRFGWITPEEFLDAVALCGLLPAPLVIVGTFVGFLVDSWQGAVAATLGIFLPAFAFTLVAHERLVRLVEQQRVRDLLDGVTAAVVGLVAVTALQLTATAFPDARAVLIGGVAFVALRWARWNVAVVVLAAAALGVGLDGFGYV